MTLLTPSTTPTPANRPLPQLRSELSRLTHRRLYRVLTLLLLGGIVVVSTITFFSSSRDADPPAQAVVEYERAVANWDRDFAQFQRDWERCLDDVPEGESPANYCGPEPDFERDKPRQEWFYADPRYLARDNLPSIVIAVTMAAAMLAFILGASSGGAEWSSRSMTLQLLWEPRRLRLLLLKGAALAVVTATTTAVAMALGLTLGAATTALRGTWEGVDAGLDSLDGQRVGDFWPALLEMAGRGIVLVVLAACFGYAIAMLVRNTGAALGTAFVYFAVVETAIRVAFNRFGVEIYVLTTNALGFVAPGGLQVPGPETTVREGGEEFTTLEMVDLSNGRALVTLLAYLAVIAIPAAISFTRRDVA